MGLYFEELEDGQAFDCGERTVGDAEIGAFAELSGDRNPLHLDDEYARGTPLGGRVAHGALGIAVATGLMAQAGLTAGTLVALLGLDWRFVAPIRPGDRLHLALRVVARRELPGRDRGVVKFVAELVNQAGVLVQSGEIVELILRKPRRPTVAGSGDPVG
ncbi:MAG: MaoC family dehydratase N-terminal domain-containing protein [Thermoanaerobaculia bacterium]|nr:MaoC family dehydratase N-terminal domain-containing protein [Thermoanaerobaculia bacterium]MBP9826649.1 MaoC family dehydratase N-terminal domain-containing protein [Thermoanaerobaculia bacterium]